MVLRWLSAVRTRLRQRLELLLEFIGPHPSARGAAATRDTASVLRASVKAAGDFAPRLVDPAKSIVARIAGTEYHIKTLTRRRLDGGGADLDLVR
jgi:hypothetical protein